MPTVEMVVEMGQALRHMMDGEDIGGIVMLLNMDADGKKVTL